MAYDKKTIIDTIKDINAGKMYLPAIQRKFVWDNEEKITRLMDSIMCGYPIGTFLYWNVSRETINHGRYSLYKFIHDYNEKDGYANEKSPGPLPPGEDILAVLDGQQRLTSLYIALQGTLALRKARGNKSDPKSYPKKELYFNVRSGTLPVDDEGSEDDCKYEFKFFTEEEANLTTQDWSELVDIVQNQQAKNALLSISYEKENIDKLYEAINLVPSKTKAEKLRKKVALLGSSPPVWFKVKDVVAMNFSPDNLTTLIIDRGWGKDKVIQQNLQTLVNRLHQNEVINYFAVKESTMDNVLDIFVRVNSGGVVLSKADLLFSTIVASWDKAREEIDGLLKNINGNKEFSFNSDFIVRCCLYILNKPFKLKVENLSTQYVKEVEEHWKNIQRAITETIKLLKELGFEDSNKFTSNNAVMPLVYWIYHSGNVGADSKLLLRKFFVCSQVRGIFGRSGDTHLGRIRDKLKANFSQFPILELLKENYGGVNLLFTEEDISRLFTEYPKGSLTYMLLTLLYPHFQYGQKAFHQDHLHPFAGFEGKKNEEKLKNVGITAGQIEEWKGRRNYLANLQLLEGRENESKNATPLIQWLGEGNNRENCKYLPKCSYELKDFDLFMEERQKLMAEKLKEILR